MQAKPLHEIVPETQSCVDCGELMSWLEERDMPYRMLPDEPVEWEIYTPDPVEFRDTSVASLRTEALAWAQERFGKRAYVRRVLTA